MEQPGPKFQTGESSFKDLFGGKTISVDNNVSAFSMLHGRALVARMIDLEALKNIYVILNGICPGSRKVQYLGALDLLISFEESDLVDRVIEAAKLMSDKFYSVVLWEGQLFSFKRLAWLKVQGVPLHLLTNEVLNIVGGKLGKVIHKAKKPEADFDLSFEYIGILAGDGKRIAEEVVLNWKNRKFWVWVTEEFGDWIPDFYAVSTVEKEPDATNGEENVGVENDVDMPETTPVNMAGVDVDAIINEDPIILERNDLVINDIDCHSSPVNGENLNSEIRKESFVPAVSFDFDQVNEDNINSVIPNSNVVKRKKIQKE
ncbi:hypothetical protein HanPSC8_Chr13g0546171 [Helianthus annuus]|nr:hypothetical protein HanPSC8_Chr13g0546171 [Helianthus annuus]